MKNHFREVIEKITKFCFGFFTIFRDFWPIWAPPGIPNLHFWGPFSAPSAFFLPLGTIFANFCKFFMIFHDFLALLALFSRGSAQILHQNPYRSSQNSGWIFACWLLAAGENCVREAPLQSAFRSEFGEILQETSWGQSKETKTQLPLCQICQILQ